MCFPLDPEEQSELRCDCGRWRGARGDTAEAGADGDRQAPLEEPRKDVAIDQESAVRDAAGGLLASGLAAPTRTRGPDARWFYEVAAEQVWAVWPRSVF